MFFLHLVKYAFCILYFLKLKKEITQPRKRRYVSDYTHQKEFTTIHLPRWSVSFNSDDDTTGIEISDSGSEIKNRL